MYLANPVAPELMARPLLLSRAEVNAVIPLALAVGLRMLGLFLLLPVLAVHVLAMPGGTLRLAGLAVGIYGLAQAVMLLPLGWLSDRIGRRKVLVGGLVIFALGGVLAASSSTPALVIAGRALQGLGAVSAVAIAAIADATSEKTRPQAMGLMGMGIAVAFAIAIVTANPLASLWGVPALFGITAVLGLLAAGAIALAPLASPKPAQAKSKIAFARLLPLGVGIFALHFALAAFFVLMPPIFTELASSEATIGIVYLVAFVASVGLVIPALIWQYQAVFGLAVLLVAITLVLMPLAGTLPLLGLLLALFFAGFNYLEATLPAKATALAPAGNVGAVSAGYAIFQALGVFVGATVSGQLAEDYNYLGGYLAATLLGLWLLLFSITKLRSSAALQQKS